MTIYKQDIAQLIEPSSLNRIGEILKEKLESTKNDKQKFFNLLHHYVEFNSVFGVGVALLSYRIASKGKFADMSAPYFNDRNMHVSSYFFDAARDEFDDSATSHRDTHRTLAQAFMLGLMSYYDIQPSTAPKNWLQQVNQMVMSGYGEKYNELTKSLFQEMAFHLASEVYATVEFKVIDSFIREEKPELHRFLQNNKVHIANEEHNSYQWLSIHSAFGGDVEAEHYGYALDGIEQACRYSEHLTDKERIAWLVEGIEMFSTVWSLFIKWC